MSDILPSTPDIATIQEMVQSRIAEEEASLPEETVAEQFKFTPLTCEEILALKQQSWLAKGLLPEIGLGVIFGPSGSGKSFIALDLVFALSKGADWFGWKTVRPCNILYVCLESSKAKYGLYSEFNIPFMLWDFTGCGTFDCYLNILRVSQNDRDAFLAGEPRANLVQVMLVDWQTGILRGLRAIGTEPDFVPAVKALCMEQISLYTNVEHVETVAGSIISKLSLNDMLGRTEMHTTSGEAD